LVTVWSAQAELAHKSRAFGLQEFPYRAGNFGIEEIAKMNFETPLGVKAKSFGWQKQSKGDRPALS
jgi:hypothetical protein